LLRLGWVFKNKERKKEIGCNNGIHVGGFYEKLVTFLVARFFMSSKDALQKY